MLWFILKPFSKSESIGDAHEFSKHSKYHGGSIPFQCHTQWTGSTCHWPPSNIWGLKLKHVVAAKGKNKQMCNICVWSAIERLWHTGPQRQPQKQKCLRLEKAACLCSRFCQRRGGLGLHKARHTNSHNHSAKECLITLIFRTFLKFASKPLLFLPEKLSQISIQETCCTIWSQFRASGPKRVHWICWRLMLLHPEVKPQIQTESKRLPIHSRCLCLRGCKPVVLRWH